MGGLQFKFNYAMFLLAHKIPFKMLIQHYIKIQGLSSLNKNKNKNPKQTNKRNCAHHVSMAENLQERSRGSHLLFYSPTHLPQFLKQMQRLTHLSHQPGAISLAFLGYICHASSQSSWFRDLWMKKSGYHQLLFTMNMYVVVKQKEQRKHSPL